MILRERYNWEDNMKENILTLRRKIDKIKTMGWIQVPRRGYGEVGLLFEGLLGVNNNDFSVPDFAGIEIKVQNRFSRFPLTLFSCTCDGPDFYEIKRIVKKYGIINRKYGDTKFLFISLSCTAFSNWGRYLKMKLYIDHKKQKLYILIAHANGKIIEKKSYWDFSTLKECLERKLKFLCYVVSDSILLNGKKFVKYNEAYFYGLKNFDIFISLLEKGYIVVNIKCGIYKRGPKEGQSYDHGTSFQISTEAISELFEPII